MRNGQKAMDRGNFDNEDKSNEQYTFLENTCIQYIYEFLYCYGFRRTADLMLEECADRNIEFPAATLVKDRVDPRHVATLKRVYGQQSVKLFFQYWDSLIPNSIKEKMEYRKLTFYLHIHFGVVRLRDDSMSSIGNGDSLDTLSDRDSPEPGRNSPSEGMTMLRNFLETQGETFSNEPELLPFYALPYVPDPLHHPSFKDLFTNKWVTMLTERLSKFLDEYSNGESVVPSLITALGPVNRTTIMQQAHQDLLHSHRHLKKRYRQLHKDHRNLIGIASELTGALEDSVKGQAVDLEATLANCAKIFPELFLHKSKPNNEAMGEQFGNDQISNIELDYKKIKNHLTNGSIKTKLLLFQALRWRITRSNPDDRDTMSSGYMRHDLLSLHQGDAFLVAHLAPERVATPHPLQQAAARLINTLTSLRMGRDYLCSPGPRVVLCLVPILKGEHIVNIDNLTTDMLIAILQKLSLRHVQRMAMIELGLVEWLINKLSGWSMGAYALEYSTALLMNLCLHRKAKERCLPIAHSLLKLLVELLGTQVPNVSPYVNGTFYSLLAHPQINQEAKRFGIAEHLQHHLKDGKGEQRKQLELILKLHRGDIQPDICQDEEQADEDVEEVDFLEEELDTEDPVRCGPNELSGDRLLYTQYRLIFPHHGVVYPNSLFPRPTTPGSGTTPNTPATTGGDGEARSPKPSDILTNQLSKTQLLAKNDIVVNSLFTTSENYLTATSSEVTLSPLDLQESEFVEKNDDVKIEEINEEIESTNEPKKAPSGSSPEEKNSVAEIDMDPSTDGDDVIVEERIEEAYKSVQNEQEFDEAFTSRPKIPRSP